MNPVGAWAPAGWETEALQAKGAVCQGGPRALDTRWRGGHRRSRSQS